MDEREQVQRKALVALVVRTSCELFHGASRAARSELDRARDDLTACLDRALDTQNDDALSDAVELALGLSRATEPHTLIATERIVGRVLDALADRRGPTWDDARARLLTARARVRYLYGEVATGAPLRRHRRMQVERRAWGRTLERRRCRGNMASRFEGSASRQKESK